VITQAAAISVVSGCTPSEDLASYSSGTGLGGGGDDVSDPAPGAGVGGGSSEAPVGNAGSGGSETGNLPDVIQGGSAGSASSSPGAGDPPMSVGSEGDPDEPAPVDPDTTPPEAPVQFRFVRLVADSAIGQGPLTSIAEFDVLDADGEPIDRTGWVVTADSEELMYVGGAQAEYAIDGDPATMWHTAWFEVEPPAHPHSLDVDMGQARAVGGFRYLPRQDDAVDGRIEDYRFFVSVDGVEWGEPVSEGDFPVDTEAQQTVLLD
jgi:large repetitive protein